MRCGFKIVAEAGKRVLTLQGSIEDLDAVGDPVSIREGVQRPSGIPHQTNNLRFISFRNRAFVADMRLSLLALPPYAIFPTPSVPEGAAL
jgi:hypothetical protein